MIYMEQEIITQPFLLKKCIENNKRVLQDIEKSIQNHEIKTIIYAARGSSDNAGLYFKYLVEINAGIIVSLAAPSVLTVFSGKLDFTNTLVVGVSQSGEAEDVCMVLEEANKQGAMTVGLTNNMESKLGKLADYTMNLSVEKEISVAATKTFTAELVLLACLATKLSKQKDYVKTITKTINQIQEIIDRRDLITSFGKPFKHINNAFILGRGYVYAIVKELALKLQETSYIKALSFASSDFYHGPIAMLDDQSYVVLLMPNDETYDDSYVLLERILLTTDHVFVMTDNPNIKYHKSIIIPKADKEFAPILFAVASQLLALEISLSNGYNPDKPRNLKKVTITK